MATYYRWRKSTYTWSYSSSIVSSGSVTLSRPDRTAYYSEGGFPEIDSGTFYFPNSFTVSTSGTVNRTGDTVGQYQDASVGYYSPNGMLVARGSSSNTSVQVYVTGGGDLYQVVPQATPGTSQGYVYSTIPGTYPNGGVYSDGYYYDQRTTVVSPTAPSGLTYPAVITTPGVSVTWTAATSNTNYAIKEYELSYSVNGGSSWTVVATTQTTIYSFVIPAGTTSLMFRVRAQDTNLLWGNYVTGTASQVLLAPTLTVPQMVMQGQSATVSWTAVEGADSYTLQRKANTDADWTQVYSGANLSYTETVGTWTSLQYRVCAVFGSTNGGWATSGDIQIVSASALVISGADGDLGILTNDVQYSISSDGTNPLNVTESINGVTMRSFAAVNGGSNIIPVVDLPTGTGSIVITATTEVSSSPVTVTRTWTYSKTAPTFPETGSVADLTQQGNTIWAKTIAEAVRTPGIWGGNLGLALSKLANAVLYDPETGGFNGIGGADATIPMVSIETGSYVGTGTYGQENPNSLTFEFEPTVLFVYGYVEYASASSVNACVTMVNPSPDYSYPFASYNQTKGTITWGKTVSWYSTNNTRQLNKGGYTYYYVAIG